GPRGRSGRDGRLFFFQTGAGAGDNPPPEPAPGARRRRDMRILVCEDQDSIRHMIQTLLQSSGHEVGGASTGAQAVEQALNEHFNIRLLDRMLPGALAGIAVTMRLRQAEKTRDLPIFIISAMHDGPARAQKAGATAFYSKPFKPLELLEKINEVARGGSKPLA